MPRREWCTNDSNEVRGRIWVVWNPNMVEFTRVESSVQYVHGMVDMQQSGFKFLFTTVYGLHTIATRSSLWEKNATITSDGDRASILRPLPSEYRSRNTKGHKKEAI
ncbi:hypothetical protein RDI58_028986 [Solanum bulbocastanum]|uniref:Uncharacterized protein n=1 Tax=Solanum bulbocastanum TaxID=147425 RepID=A0AAN8SR09_SOLBU